MRVVIPAPLSTLEVLRDLEVEVGFPIRPISQEKRNVVIACTSDVEMQTMLGLDGAKFEGRVVKIQRAEYSMTGDELFAFVRRLLETDEELASLRRSYGCVEKVTRKDVHAVQISAGGGGMDGRDSPVVPTSPAISEGRADKFSGGARNTSSTPAKKANPPRGGRGGGQGRASSTPNASRGKGKGGEANPAKRGRFCLTCWQENQPISSCEHDHRTCPLYLAKQKKREEKGKEGGGTPNSAGHRSE